MEVISLREVQSSKIKDWMHSVWTSSKIDNKDHIYFPKLINL